MTDNNAAISPDDLGMLVWCAMGYDRRLPGGVVPSSVWEMLSPAWRGKINAWKDGNRDVLGAEVRHR